MPVKSIPFSLFLKAFSFECKYGRLNNTFQFILEKGTKTKLLLNLSFLGKQKSRILYVSSLLDSGFTGMMDIINLKRVIECLNGLEKR